MVKGRKKKKETETEKSNITVCVGVGTESSKLYHRVHMKALSIHFTAAAAADGVQRVWNCAFIHPVVPDRP